MGGGAIKAVISGSSGWHDPRLIEYVIADLERVAADQGEPLTLVVDDYEKGVDPVVRALCEQRGVDTVLERTRWDRGESAGRARNVRVLDRHRPEQIFALVGGSGKTSQMDNLTDQARHLGVPVSEIASVGPRSCEYAVRVSRFTRGVRAAATPIC